MKKLYWIFPCYNEEECLPFTAKSITTHFNKLVEDKKIDEQSKIVLVDDGSKDNTWNIISNLAKENSSIIGLKLSRNKGHQYAIEVGLRFSYEQGADLTITMDVDLQDDINVISEMIDKNEEGYEIVYGVRNNRKSDSFFKRSTAKSYYRFLKRQGVEIVENAADFRLISRVALKALLDYHEANLFFRGLVPQVGYKSAKVEYRRLEREKGKTHFPLSKMVSLAIDGITSFSDRPLYFLGKFGLFVSCLSLISALTFMVLHLCKVLDFSMWYYVFSFMAFNTGLILMGLGILGIYLGKINIETKHRPHYFIEETTLDDNA